MKNYTVNFLPEKKKITVGSNTLLADALADAGFPLDMPCGGRGICGKCKIKAEGELSEKTKKEEETRCLQPGYRLACQTRLVGDARVHVQTRTLAAIKSCPSFDINGDYGMAIDIGTTSVQIALVDLVERKSYLLDSFLNPQRRYGHDVISRIAAAREPNVFQDLIGIIRKRIFSSLVNICEAVRLSPDRIRQLIFSGNTTMLYFLFGLDVSSLGTYPYQAKHLSFKRFKINDIDGHNIFPDAGLSALPAVSAFLGSDLVGGLALCHAEGLNRNIFFIDLGTNGEMFVINSAGRIAAASCAMGPALEGMNISCGMTASPGAITHIFLNQGRLEYEMISDGPPVGMTGTAVIDLLSILLGTGHVTASGSFHPEIGKGNLPFPLRYECAANIRQISLWENISLTQTDIRNVQLAKGASLAAARILLTEIGCSLEDIEHVVIAGALGQNIDLDNFCRLKFIPYFPAAKYHFSGNTSLQAAERSCLDKEFVTAAYILRDRVQDINLARNPDFEREFLAALNFS